MWFSASRPLTRETDSVTIPECHKSVEFVADGSTWPILKIIRALLGLFDFFKRSVETPRANADPGYFKTALS